MAARKPTAADKAASIFWLLVHEPDQTARLRLAEEFLGLRQRDEDENWLEAQANLTARLDRELAQRRDRSTETRRENAKVESARRKRQWLKFRGAIRADHAFRNLPESAWNAEADKRLVDWLLTTRGDRVSAKTIANQRSRERWLEE
jgi:hypothetical protein